MGLMSESVCGDPIQSVAFCALFNPRLFGEPHPSHLLPAFSLWPSAPPSPANKAPQHPHSGPASSSSLFSLAPGQPGCVPAASGAEAPWLPHLLRLGLPPCSLSLLVLNLCSSVSSCHFLSLCHTHGELGIWPPVRGRSGKQRGLRAEGASDGPGVRRGVSAPQKS